jgi:hypothetical protein
MPPEVLDALGPIAAMVGMGTFTLIGLRMFWGYKTRRLELERSAPTESHVEELVEDLRAEIHLLRGDMGELQERVDFAERLLARGQEGKGAPNARP